MVSLLCDFWLSRLDSAHQVCFRTSLLALAVAQNYASITEVPQEFNFVELLPQRRGVSWLNPTLALASSCFWFAGVLRRILFNFSRRGARHCSHLACLWSVGVRRPNRLFNVCLQFVLLFTAFVRRFLFSLKECWSGWNCRLQAF